MRHVLATCVLAAALVQTAPSAQTAPPSPPRLAVIIVVDQMRADYVERFKDEWTGGLRRLVTRGAWFTNAAYPYLMTFTCAGHATISTGALPRRHGILQNNWFDRDARKIVTCTEDPSTRVVSYGLATGTGDSAHRLLVPTFADEMRAARQSRVVTLSLKARSAVMLAGHGGDAVTWRSESLNAWETSTAFGAAVPAVRRFIARNNVDADYGQAWNRRAPADRYQHPDDLPGETPPRGWTSTFPHVLGSASGKPDEDFHYQWERSPRGDAYLGRLAADLVGSFRLGRRGTTDVLGVSFSTPDLVGHAFGPLSQEVEDVYLNLDRTIGALLDRLDSLVGRSQYVVALTADHGVTGVPEQLKAEGRDAGRLGTRALAEIVEKAAQAALGPGRYVAQSNYNDVYFEPGMYEKLVASPAALASVLKSLSSAPGVDRVFRREELADTGAASSSDASLRAAALSYVPGRSGDLIASMKPGWMFTASATTHGSATPDDQRVPILLFGRGIKPGVYADAATPADVAPTLAALAGITMPQADGRVLGSALASPLPAVSTRP
jgi:predicted AlkP superfamily pyrophosphatase or phosphodiesterase